MFKHYLFSFFLTLIFFMSFWSIDTAIIPLTLITILYVIPQQFNKKEINFSVADLLMVFLLSYELYSFINSINQETSLIFLQKIIFLTLLYFNLKTGLNKTSLFNLLTILSAYFFIINILEVLLFILHYNKVIYYEFSDLTQFRNLFLPFGILSNEWVSVLLLMLIFPSTLYLYILKSRNKSFGDIPDVSFLKSKLFFLGIILSINIILFNIIISFSRAAYIALVIIFISIYLILYLLRVSSLINTLKYTLFLLIVPAISLIFIYRPIQSTILMNSSLSHERSIVGRLSTWKSSLSIFQEQPINGIGTYNFALYYNSSEEKNKEKVFTARVSSSYLQFILEKGIVGLLCYISFLFLFIFAIFKYYKAKKHSSIEKYFLIISASCLMGLLVRELTFSSIFFSDSILVLMCLIYLLWSKILIVPNKIIRVNKWHSIFLELFVLSILILLFIQSYTNKQFDKFNKEFEKKEFAAAHSIIYDICSYRGNGYYLSCKALSFIRQYENDRMYTLNMPISKLDTCISIYKNAIELDNKNGSFFNNIGWLHFYRNDYKIAFEYMNKAKKTGSYNSIFYVSSGLMCLATNERDKAINDFTHAILLSPDILDSKLWKDLETEQPQLSECIIKNVLISIESTDTDIISLSKKAKIYIYQKKYNEAKDILLNVTTQMPNLGRPWNNLGYIYQTENNPIKMIESYNIALLNSPNYYITYLNLAKYYEDMGLNQESTHYYKISFNLWNQISTDHYSQGYKIYQTEGLKNDMIPLKLLEYAKPQMDTSLINQKILNREK